MRISIRSSLNRIVSKATCGLCGGDDTSHMHSQDVHVTPRHSNYHSQETVRYSAIATSNPSLPTRNTTYPTSTAQYESPNDIPRESSIPRDAKKGLGVEHQKRSATSLVEDQGSMHSRKGESERSSPRTREQSKPPPKMDHIRSRRDAPHGVDHPSPKVTIEVTQPLPPHAIGAESIARPSPMFQQLFEAQSEELSASRNKLRAAAEEKRAMDDAYASLMRQLEEKSRKVSALHDEHQAVLEQKKNAEKDCAILRQRYKAVALEQKQNAEHDFDVLRKESGVQTDDHSTPRHKHCVPLEENRTIADAYATLRQQYEAQSRELSTMRHRHQQAETDCAVLRRHHEEQSRSLSAMRHECQIALEQKGKLQNDCTILRQEYEAQRNQNSALRHDYHSLKAAFEQRTSELHGVERFLTTADTFSGAEVVNTLRTLNGGVPQSITSMAEWMVNNLPFDRPRTDQAGVLEIVEQTRTSELLGMRFMRLLGAKMHRDNPILLEMALQAFLMYELYQVASQRTIIQGDQSHVAFIDGIYQKMREAEGQAISGNWRALTHQYTAPAWTSDSELAHIINTTIISGFSDILFAAGCTTSKPDITSVLVSKFAKKIHDFVSLAGHINRIIGAGVVSEDFEVLVISPGTSFDEKVMEDWDDDGVRAHKTSNGMEELQETVLCATELGLMKRIKGELSAMVIKPKVALMSVLDIINE